MATKLRSKMAFLNYDSMLSKIASGDLDAYDVIFTRDSKQCFVVSPDLKPCAIHSKVYTFDSTITAVSVLNKNDDTYAGQIVAVLNDDKYVGYIVNGSKGHFYITSLSLSNDIDYNTLGNRPIENLTGSLAESVILDENHDGIYKITGRYKISNSLDTVFSATNDTLFYVYTDEDIKYVKKVSSKETILYKISDGKVIQDEVITKNYLTENNYATKEDVQNIVDTLDTYVQDTTKEYIKEYLNTDSGVQSVLQDTVEQIIDEKFVPTDDSDISDIFS